MVNSINYLNDGFKEMMAILQLHPIFAEVPIYHVHIPLYMLWPRHVGKQCKHQHQNTGVPGCAASLWTLTVLHTVSFSYPKKHLCYSEQF